MSEERATTTERSSTAIGMHGFVPANAKELLDMATFVSKAGICPDALRGKPNDCFVVMATGLEYGFTAMSALSMIHIVKGRPSLGYEACLAKMQSHPLCDFVRISHEGEGDDRCAVIRTKRKGREENEPIRFSVRDARQAGLYDEDWRDRNGEPSVWVKYTDDQLVAKVVARSKRRDWADMLPGLQVYEDVRELREERNVTPPKPARPPLELDPAIAAIKALSAPRERISVELPTRELEIVESEATVNPPSKAQESSTPATVASDSDPIAEPAPEAPDELRRAIWTRATQTSNAHKAAPLIEALVREKHGRLDGSLEHLGSEDHKDSLDLALTTALNCRVDLKEGRARYGTK